MEVFKTADVPQESRASYWNQVYSSRFAPITVDPARHGRFQAELKVGALGALEFACVRSRPTAVERRPDRTSERMLGFIMIVHGAGMASHCGHETPLEAGDILMTDSWEAVRSRFDAPMEGITVRTPEAQLRCRLPGFESLLGRRLPSAAGLTDTAVAMAKSLSMKLDGALPPDCAAKASGHLLDIISTSYALAFSTPAEEESLTAARRARVAAFIEDNLADPELCPGAVASSVGISPRYLRKLMSEKGETASSFILRRRLEECARDLVNDVRRSRSITDIAFSWGFNSTTHFARVFKSKYGVSPRDFRAPSAIPR